MCNSSHLRHVCVCVWVSHLSGHWWTHPCSSASAAGSTCAERRCTAMLGRLERAGQTGTYTCTNTNVWNIYIQRRKKENHTSSGEVQACRYSAHQRKEARAKHQWTADSILSTNTSPLHLSICHNPIIILLPGRYFLSITQWPVDRQMTQSLSCGLAPSTVILWTSCSFVSH